MDRKVSNRDRANAWIHAINNNDIWSKKTNEAIMDTIVYRGESFLNPKDIALLDSIERKSKTVVEVTTYTTWDAIVESHRCSYENICALNFASFFNPGGGYITGASAQEESLCAVSNLFPILKKLDIYEERSNYKDCKPEYESELIYTPSVLFTTWQDIVVKDPIEVDVLSCAAPNCYRAKVKKYSPEYEEALKERIEAIFIYPALNGAKTLILGAWGCGVFGNSPKYVATEFQKAIDKYGTLYDNIIFAMPNKKQFDIFWNIIGRYHKN